MLVPNNRLEKAKHSIEDVFNSDELIAWRNDETLWSDDDRRQIGLKMNHLFNDVLPFPMTVSAGERTDFMERVSFEHINATLMDALCDPAKLAVYEKDCKISHPMLTWEYCRTSCIRYTEIWQLIASMPQEPSTIIFMLHFPGSIATKQTIEEALRDFEENGGRTMVDALFEGVPLGDIIGGRTD